MERENPLVFPAPASPSPLAAPPLAPPAAIARLGSLSMDSASETPLWQLIVALLPQRDPSTEWFTLPEVACLLNLTPHSLSKHARDLWPSHEGYWRLNYSQAVALIRRVCYAGRKVPSRAQVLAALAQAQVQRGEATC